jgi:hypothetical protein
LVDYSWIWIVGRSGLGFLHIGAYFGEKVRLHFFFVSLISCLVVEKSEENARKMMAWNFQKMARGRERGTITGERS